MACVPSTEDWLRKRNEIHKKHMTLSVCASFVWLMTELQQKKRNSLLLSEKRESILPHHQ